MGRGYCLGWGKEGAVGYFLIRVGGGGGYFSGRSGGFYSELKREGGFRGGISLDFN